MYNYIKIIVRYNILFEEVENKKISQIVIEQIQEMIMSGRLKEGDALPPERELTEALGIGRPSLREALKALEVLGLVERRHEKGNYIVNNVSSNFFKPMSLSFRLAKGGPYQIWQLRYMVETFVTPYAAEVADEQDIAELRAIHEEMKLADNPEQIRVLDRKFHYRIAEITGNNLILSTLNNASFLLDAFGDEVIRVSKSEGEDLEEIFDEHEKIIDAIEAHDEEAAFKAISEHLGNIRTELMEY